MRVEDAKEELKKVVTPIVEQFCTETGLRISSIDVSFVDITNIDDKYSKFKVEDIRLSLNYGR